MGDEARKFRGVARRQGEFWYSIVWQIVSLITPVERALLCDCVCT